MKTAKYFDVMDHDITPEIYTLLFSDAFVELTGNDTWYKINPLNWWEDYEGTTYLESSQKQFQRKLDRGYHNCYHTTEAMKNLCENPITCEEALKRFKQWLLDKGVTPEDTLFVKIWW